MSPNERALRARIRRLQNEIDDLKQELHIERLCEDMRASAKLTPADIARINAFVAAQPRPKKAKKGTLRALIDNTK